MSEDKPVITLGGLPVQSANDPDAIKRFAMMLWGPSGAGKTTFCLTAPGKKLWLNFDPEGFASVIGRDDVVFVDFSQVGKTVVNKFRTDEGLGLGKFIDDHNIETVVVDSLTSYSQTALESFVGKEGNSTIEKPGISSYGARNALTLRLVQAVLRETGRKDCNVIFISHEDAPVTNKEGEVLYITMQLGGKLGEQTALQLSEVWFMQDTEKGRRIAIRPCRSRKPMKTRMFETNGPVEFWWKYDINKPDPKYELATWYNQWREKGGKIPVPT